MIMYCWHFLSCFRVFSPGSWPRFPYRRSREGRANLSIRLLMIHNEADLSFARCALTPASDTKWKLLDGNRMVLSWLPVPCGLAWWGAVSSQGNQIRIAFKHHPKKHCFFKWYPFHPRGTAVARKRSRSFCQKCRWQVTAKHAYTLRRYVALHEVTWCMVVWCTQNLRQDGSSFMWHQPCQRCKYTTSVDI